MVHVLSHNGCQSAELEDVARHQEQGVEDLFFLASTSACREGQDEKGEGTEHGKYEIHHIEGGFPELLFRH